MKTSIREAERERIRRAFEAQVEDEVVLDTQNPRGEIILQERVRTSLVIQKKNAKPSEHGWTVPILIQYYCRYGAVEEHRNYDSFESWEKDMIARQ